MLANESYFKQFRKGVVGSNLHTPSGKKVIYADWTASGRLHKSVEQYISSTIGPYVANTHTESTLTGATTTQAYDEAKQIIKQHVNADENDVIISAGSGMTELINKLQRIMGLKVENKTPLDLKPLVLITHMEHHSNQVSWHECDVTVEIVPENKEGLPDLFALQTLLEQYADRPLKIGSFTACSNVTGLITPYHEMARLMHLANGVCFIDFAASAPYVNIDMHPSEGDNTHLDAVFMSPHKFLGGPGSTGIMVFNKALYQSQVPDRPGGGTVLWTNPWGEHKYYDDIETREDGGTPAFLQTIRAALAIKLKESMGVKNIQQREKSITDYLYNELNNNKNIVIFQPNNSHRLSVLSFYIPGAHHNLIVKLLDDKFGVQARGGCSCAGTYGHKLFDICQRKSAKIVSQLEQGNMDSKPGWIRISLHPVNTNAEIKSVVNAINRVSEHYAEWSKEYIFNPNTAEFSSVKKVKKPISLTEFSPILSVKDRLKDILFLITNKSA